MIDNRKHERFSAEGKVLIEGVMDYHPLRDISVTGCRIECSHPADLRPESQYKLTIIPESRAGIRDFELFVECRWVQQEGNEVGFAVVSSPSGTPFHSYVDYLAYRHAQQ